VANLVQLEFQGGHHAEIASAATQAPEDILVLTGAGGDKIPVRCDHIGGEEVVDREPERPCQVADATPQGEARDAGGRDDAARRRQAESVGGVIEVPPCCAGVSTGSLTSRVHMHCAHRRRVDDQSAIVGPESGRAMRAVANGQIQSVVAGEVHAGYDVGRCSARSTARGRLSNIPLWTARASS
jgi:hypothetical protein